MIQFAKRFFILTSLWLFVFNQGFSADIKEVLGADLLKAVKYPFFDINQAKYSDGDQDQKVIDVDQIADSLTQKVLSENKIVDLIDPEKVYTLPIGIGKNIGGLYYIIVLDELSFSPSGLTAKAYMSLSFPGSSKKFGLVADEVKIGVDGIQAAKLKMLKDKKIDLPSGNSMLIKADSTFVEWDCNGYKGTQLSADIILDEKKFLKENPIDRTILNNQKVTGRVMCSVVDFNDILLEISLDPFQLKDLKDFSFYPEHIVFDMSDTRNADAMRFPDGYNSVLFDGANKNLWRGIYISSFSMKFPKKLAKGESTPSVRASDFLVDCEGITGSLSTNYPIITLDKGSIGGWKFSVNFISLSLQKNDIANFTMSGGIVLPITDPNKPLDYMASIDSDKNFLFQVSLPNTKITTPVFGSSSYILINSNSTVSVSTRDGEFYPKAVLHGKLNIQVPGSSGAALADITFQGLTIQRDEPQVDIEALSMQSGMMSGFPVQVTEIKVQKDKEKKDLGLLFSATANLMNGKIEGETSFVIWATRADGDWKFKSFELRKIAVDADLGNISIKGQLINYKDDAVYGNGYFGAVEMSLTPGIAVSATAQFGNVAGDRYWYADASVKMASGISVFPGFAIYGFGGGAYYHMQRNVPVNILMESNAETPSTPKPGKTDSGITYTPNKNIALGLSAKVIIGTQPSPSAFNGSVTFGMEFSSDFGLKKLYFLGDGRFMTEMNKSGDDAKVKAAVSIDYQIDNRELQGYADAFINVAGVVKGAGSNNLAGRVEFYFAKKKWHIYVGTPTSPVSVKLMSMLTASSYFMVGTELPDFPALPDNVASLSSKINFTNMRSEGMTKTGGGFAFGASINASTGEKSFLIFYGSFNLGAGFDLMLKNFGTNARCEGLSGPLGINGWYAQGQAWAYVSAKIGVKVKVFRRTKKFNILDASFAAALGAQLPNPTYFAGAVEAKFSVLGGLVKGKCHFEFDYGHQCKLENASAVEGISVIAELTPAEGGNNVDVFIAPQVAFNMPIGQDFKILDTDGQEKAFRVALDYFKILDNEQEIASAMDWNSSKDVLALKPVEVLPGQKNLKASIKVHFQYLDGGAWKDYTVDGNVEGEEKVVPFKTGDAPDYITENNVKYTYPLKNMVNFYKNEYEKCYIQLSQGVDYLFSKPGEWTYYARFVSSGNTLNMPVTYIKESKRVEMKVPASLLNSTIYKMRILRVPSSASTLVVDKNVTNTENNISEDQSVTTKDIQGTLSEEGLTELYSLHFRASQFNNFTEKLSKLSVSYSRLSITGFIKQLHLNYKGVAPDYELFDGWEMQNIKIEAIVDQTPWYANNYKNLIYQSYPIVGGMEIEKRPVNSIGVPPIWVANLAQYTEIPALTQNVLTEGKLRFDSNSSTRIEHNLCYYVTNDWGELRNKTFVVDRTNANPLLNRIKESSYTGIYSSSRYPVKLMYYIPGQTTPTSEFLTTILY